MPYTRQTASPWFSSPGFLGLFPSPIFPRMPRLLAARQKETASETTIGEDNPSAQVLAPLEGRGFSRAKCCPASVGFLPPLCWRSASLCFGCSGAVVGAVRCVGAVMLGKGVCTTIVDTLRTFNCGKFCFCQGQDKCYAPLTKTLFWCVSPIEAQRLQGFLIH